MLDLYHATRDELIAMVLRERDMVADRDRRITTLESAWAQQQATIAQLTAQVGALAAAAATADDSGQGTPKGMPGLKPTQPPERERRPRKQRAKGFARRRHARSMPWRRVRIAGRRWPGARSSGRER